MAKPCDSKSPSLEGNKKKSKTFETYWDQKNVDEGLLDGSLVEGVLRINPKNYKEAYISSPDGSGDILIEGLLNRNRALNGDIIVCKLEQATKTECRSDNTSLRETIKNDEQVSTNTVVEPIVPNNENKKKPKEKLKKKTSFPKTGEAGNKERSAEKSETDSQAIPSNDKDADEVSSEKKKKSRRSKKKKNCPVVSLTEKLSVSCNISASTAEAMAHVDITKTLVSEGNGLLSVTDEITEIKQTSENIVRTTAKVIFIREYKHSRCAIGTLRPWPYGQTRLMPSWILFVPKDYRIPRLKIPFTPDLATCLANPSMLYMAKIESWEDINHPQGSLCYVIGESGDIEAETIGLLLEHEVDYSPFPSHVLDDLPELPWSIPVEEIKKRRDFREQCIFTIDPADARDLDDAVSGRFLKLAEDGVTRLYKVSVHIADVSFFVRDNTPLDDIASQRATSVYLVDRVIPMLPSILCEHVCSLNPGEDRLAYSVEWTVNDRGEILEEWFGRSVIRSCVKLSYDHAQAAIEGKDIINWPEVKGPHTQDDVRQTVLVLQELANHLRKKRVDQGALRIDLPRLAFSMDWKTRTPIGFRVYELKESNRLIEEFMLLANMRVAEKIYEEFPDLAVLRCHPPPLMHKLEQLSDLLQTIGIHLDVSSSATLQESLIRYGQGSQDPLAMGRNLVISNLLAKPMKCASYICSGVVKKQEFFRHYALSVPFYTHFTSPIRRYPDILVHRLLSAALEGRKLTWEQTIVKKLLDNCNSRKLASKALQETHSELHLANLIRRSGSIEVKGIVLSVLDRAVDVVLIYLGIVRRLYLDKLPLEQLSHEKHNGIGKLTLVWRPELPGRTPVQQVISVFSLLEILLVPHTEIDKLDFTLELQRPVNTPPASL